MSGRIKNKKKNIYWVWEDTCCVIPSSKNSEKSLPCQVEDKTKSRKFKTMDQDMPLF